MKKICSSVWMLKSVMVAIVAMVALFVNAVEVRAYDREGALISASRKGNLERVQELLTDNVDINAQRQDGMTALMWASVAGHVDIVRALLEAGADLKVKDDNGTTALLWASYGGHVDVVQEMMAKARNTPLINSNAQVKYRWTALGWANFSGQTELVEALKGYAVNKTYNYVVNRDSDWTPLMWTSYHNMPHVVKVLLKVGEDVNATDKNGVTALMLACFHGHVNVVQELLQAHGVNVNAKDHEGATALMYAQDNNHTQIIDLLKRAGARTPTQNNLNGNGSGRGKR